MAYDFLMNCFARLHELVRDCIRLNQVRSEGKQNISPTTDLPEAIPPVNPISAKRLIATKPFHHRSLRDPEKNIRAALHSANVATTLQIANAPSQLRGTHRVRH